MSPMQDKVTEAVRAQYEAYSYPLPLEDLTEVVKQNIRMDCDPSVYSRKFWPEGRPRQDLQILVAGCGSRQAASLALFNPECSVLGIDLSETSLGHQARLRDKHDLKNLELKHLNLLDVGTLGRTFDLIACHGVLMCLANPDDGIRALADVLEPHGVMHLMLYGRAGRAGVYLMQDVFQRMGIGQDEPGLTFTRELIGSLPNYHYFSNMIRQGGIEDLTCDAGLVDTFLHPQDVAHSAPEIVNFVERAGLTFVSWSDNGRYYPDHFFKGDLLKRISALPDVDQWAVVENILLHHIMHEFIVCKPERKANLIDFSGLDWLGYVPHLSPYSNVSGYRQATWQVSRLKITTPLDQIGVFFMTQIDGKRSISDILTHPNLANNPQPARLAVARAFFPRMWRLGHLIYTRP